MHPWLSGGVPNTIHTPDPPHPLPRFVGSLRAFLGQPSSHLRCLHGDPSPVARVLCPRGCVHLGMITHTLFPFPPILFCYRFCPEEKRCRCAFTTTSGRSEWWSRHPTSSLHYHVQQDAGKKSQPVGTAHWAASRADVSRLSGGLLGVSHSGSWEAHSHPAGGAHNRLRPDSWRN